MQKKCICITLAILLLTIGLCFGQENTPLSALLPTTGHNLTGQNIPVTVFSLPAELSLYYDEQGALKNAVYSVQPNAYSFDVLTVQYDPLWIILTKKYGPPDITANTSPGQNSEMPRTATWNEIGMDINLALAGPQMPWGLYIEYAAKDAASKLPKIPLSVSISPPNPLPKLLVKTENDIRNVKWGMSEEDVKASEDVPCNNEIVGVIEYKCHVMAKEMYLYYSFVDHKLTDAIYKLSDNHSNQNAYIDDYNVFKGALEKKYGPGKERIRWLNDSYKDRKHYWGRAVSMGHLRYSCFWETESTNILLILNGDNYESKCAILYRSKELEHLVEMKTQKEANDAL